MLRTSLIISLTLFLLHAHNADTTADTTATKNTGKCSEGLDKNCGQCVLGKCTMCWDMYADTDGICQKPTTTIENCETYLTATTCKSCKLGYKLSTDTTCVKNTNENCLVEVADKCTICDGYSISTTGKCETKCPDNCRVCIVSGDSSICSTCIPGHYITTSLTDLFGGNVGTCKKADGDLGNCVSLANKCVNCFTGGYVKSKSGEDMRCEGGKFSMILAAMVSGLMSFLIF